MINETLFKLHQIKQDFFFHMHLKLKRVILSNNEELGHLI